MKHGVKESPMRDEFFTFKQFKLRHRDAAMKVGTDAVLLGSWAFDATIPDRILDVGTGCGILALMLSQRFPKAQIEAIELEKKAFHEAQNNFENSPFSERLKIALGDFLEWNEAEKFDAIICNPPYYQDKISSSIPERNMARQERFLPPAEFWLKVSGVLKHEKGRVAVVLPLDRIKTWEEQAAHYGMTLRRKCWIKGNQTAPISRVLLEWALNKDGFHFVESEVIIEQKRGVLNSSYLNWTQDFLLEKE